MNCYILLTNDNIINAIYVDGDLKLAIAHKKAEGGKLIAMSINNRFPNWLPYEEPTEEEVENFVFDEY